MQEDQLQSYLSGLTIDQKLKAQLWSAFTESANEDELTEKLKQMPVSKEVKGRLWDMKYNPEQPAIDIPPQGARETLQSGALGRFGKAMYAQTVDPLIQALTNPAETGQAFMRQLDENRNFPGGPLAAMAARGIIEPVKTAIDQARQGQYPEAGGTVAGAALPWMLSAGARNLRVPIEKSINPIEQRAVNTALQKGVPVSLPQMSQNPVVLALSDITSRIPFLADVGAKFRLKQQQALKAALSNVSQQVSPTGKPWTIYDAGEELQKVLPAKGEQLKKYADVQYDKVREIAARKDTQKVVTGYETSKILDANGQPIPIPVTEEIIAPIDVRRAKQMIAPAVEEASRAIEKARGGMNPGLISLQQILDWPDQVDLASVDKTLSQLKKTARGALKYSRNASQGKAVLGIRALEKAVKEKMVQLGPDADVALDLGRYGVRNQKKIEKIDRTLMGAGREEELRTPVGPVRHLLAPGDRNFRSLEFMNKLDPEKARAIGAARLEELINNVDKETQGWKGVLNNYLQMGEKTRNLLYPGGMAQDIEDLLRMGYMTSREVNPSRSAILIGSMYVMANPVKGTVYVLSARPLVKAMYAPGGAKLLAEGLRIPMLTPATDTITTSILINAGLKDQIEKK